MQTCEATRLSISALLQLPKPAGAKPVGMMAGGRMGGMGGGYGRGAGSPGGGYENGMGGMGGMTGMGQMGQMGMGQMGGMGGYGMGNLPTAYSVFEMMAAHVLL